MTFGAGEGEHNNPAELTEAWGIYCALDDKITPKSRGAEFARAFCVILTGHMPADATPEHTGMSRAAKLGQPDACPRHEQ